MVRLKEFIRKERLYILLLVFVILMNILMNSIQDEGKGKSREGISNKTEKALTLEEDIAVKRREMERRFKDNPYLAIVFSLTSLLVIAVMFLGILINGLLISMGLSKRGIDLRTSPPPAVNWNLWDVAKVVILFIFFGYMVVLIESALARVFPVMKNDNFRMILNSAVLDTLGIVFILYFSIAQYKERLIALGITGRNFLKNVYYGVIGYIAAVPILMAIMIATVVVINLTGYVPEKQAIVELFLKEENAPFLLFSAVFAAIGGPIIEELFFMAFFYNALKRYAGVLWAMLATSAVFAALHAHIVGFVPIMVLGIILAYLYEKTGTIISSITVHVIHNLTMVLFVFLAKQVS